MWTSAEEEMSIEEAIQLSLALEESERCAKEEAAARSKLQVSFCIQCWKCLASMHVSKLIFTAFFWR